MIHYAHVMPAGQAVDESSIDSAEEGRVAVRATPPPPSAPPPVQSGKAKPVTLAEIKFRLARKASLEAKKRLKEDDQSATLLAVAEKPAIPSAEQVVPTTPVKPVSYVRIPVDWQLLTEKSVHRAYGSHQGTLFLLASKETA